MNINLLKSTDYECEFLLSESSGPIANALRKTMMNNIPVFAIDKIEEIKNSSVLTNEQIIQRLNYIPIVSSVVDKFEIYNECKCDKECEKCSIPFSINVSNNGKKNITVYADEIKIENSEVKVYKENPKYSIPITKLAPNQTLIVKGLIKKGKGKQHSKYNPVGTAYYKFMPVVKIKDEKEMSKENKNKLVKVCPVNVFSLNSKNKVSDIEDLMIDSSKCTMCNECVYQFPQNAEIGYSTDTILFYVESVGSLKVNKIVNDSIEYLKNI